MEDDSPGIETLWSGNAAGPNRSLKTDSILLAKEVSTGEWASSAQLSCLLHGSLRRGEAITGPLRRSHRIELILQEQTSVHQPIQRADRMTPRESRQLMPGRRTHPPGRIGWASF